MQSTIYEPHIGHPLTSLVTFKENTPTISEEFVGPENFENEFFYADYVRGHVGIGMTVECCRRFLDLEVGQTGTVAEIDGYRERCIKVKWHKNGGKNIWVHYNHIRLLPSVHRPTANDALLNKFSNSVHLDLSPFGSHSNSTMDAKTPFLCDIKVESVFSLNLSIPKTFLAEHSKKEEGSRQGKVEIDSCSRFDQFTGTQKQAGNSLWPSASDALKNERKEEYNGFTSSWLPPKLVVAGEEEKMIDNRSFESATMHTPEVEESEIDEYSPTIDKSVKQGNSGKFFPPEAVLKLNKWFEAHKNLPYPTPDEKAILAAETGLLTKQVSRWVKYQRSKMAKDSLQIGEKRAIQPLNPRVCLPGRSKPPRRVKSKNLNDLKVKCEICGETYRNKHVLKVHLLRHQDERRYACNLCSCRFNTTCDLYSHKKYKHTSKEEKYVFPCTFCGRKYISKSDLSVHEKRWCKKKPFE